MFAGSLGLQRPVRPLRVGDEGLLQTRWGLTVLSVLSSVSRAGALKSNHATQWDLTPRRRPAEERPGGLPGAPRRASRALARLVRRAHRLPCPHPIWSCELFSR